MSTFPAELTGTWDIDAVHSTVGFTAKHAMVATTRGHFRSSRAAPRWMPPAPRTRASGSTSTPRA